MKNKYFLIILITIAAIFLSWQQPQIKGVFSGDDELLKVYFFDVGQGDAILLRTPDGDDILIDGGANKVILDKLGQYLPINDWDIELMVLTHGHADHIVGLIDVLNNYEVKKILHTGVETDSAVYHRWQKAIAEEGAELIKADSRKEIKLNDLILQILYPNQDISQKAIDNLNNASIAIRAVYGQSEILLTGDLEIEEKLVDNEFDLTADILKLGHHGANNANDILFLQAVNPQYAVASVGEDNFYGHPHFRVLNNLNRLGVELFRTDRDGDVIFYCNLVNCDRQLNLPKN